MSGAAGLLCQVATYNIVLEESYGMSYHQNTKTLLYIFLLVVTGLWSEVYSTNAQVNVTPGSLPQ